MKISLLEYIHCPVCENTFDLLATAQKSAGEIEEGLLTCRQCNRWFPVRDSLPEILPDSLRSKENDLLFLNSIASRLEPNVIQSLVEMTKTISGRSFETDDTGTGYKKAEMTIKTKVSDPSFFGPGSLSPFNPVNAEFTWQLIRRFGNVLPLLELKPCDVVLDIGAGYAWTSEWLMKMGFTVIGVDICRTYLDIGLKRMKGQAPHMIVADVENLPLKAGCLNAILCFDAFHHVYDRKKAMKHFWRVLKNGGNVILAEPGSEHESAEPAQEVMEKYGILEKGMSLDDLKSYCLGSGFSTPEEHFIIDIKSEEKKKILTKKFIQSHIYADCHFFRIKKL